MKQQLQQEKAKYPRQLTKTILTHIHTKSALHARVFTHAYDVLTNALFSWTRAHI